MLDELLLGKLAVVEARFEELSAKLSDPEVLARPQAMQKLAKEHSDIRELVDTLRVHRQTVERVAEAREMQKHNPDTPCPSPASTRATRCRGRVLPTIPLWPLPLSALIALGSGCTETIPVSACAVNRVATMRAVPRCAPPTTRPESSFGTEAMALSSEDQTIGVLGMTSPALSSATATRSTESPLSTDAPLVRIATAASK